VSVGWTDFEGDIQTQGLSVSDATLIRDNIGVKFSGGGNMGETDQWVEFEIIGQNICCERSDGLSTSTDQLLELSKAYWDAFGRR